MQMDRSYFLRRFTVSCCLLLIVSLAGCGGGPKIVPAKGKVLLDGEPLKFGGVMLQPESGGQKGLSARSHARGWYRRCSALRYGGSICV